MTEVQLLQTIGLCVLGLGVALATHDTWPESRQDKKTQDRPASAPDLPDAA